MSKKDEILNCCRGQARTAGEIASLLEVDKTLVKITLLYCFKRGLVTREKKDRTGKGPKQEFFYICAS
jgi:predicted transcriptional regulator